MLSSFLGAGATAPADKTGFDEEFASADEKPSGGVREEEKVFFVEPNPIEDFSIKAEEPSMTEEQELKKEEQTTTTTETSIAIETDDQSQPSSTSTLPTTTEGEEEEHFTVESITELSFEDSKVDIENDSLTATTNETVENIKSIDDFLNEVQ